MKNKKIKYLQLSWFLIAGILILIQFFTKLNFGDDVTYSKVLTDKSLFTWLQERYMWWSSRVMIESIMVPLIYLKPFVWRILNGLMIVCAIVLVEKTFTKGNKYINRIILSCIMFAIPISSLKNAGWITTTTNYLWVLTFGLVAIYSLKTYINGIPSLVVFFISIPSIIYAANMEQMAAILLGSYLVAGVYIIYKKKKFHWMYFCQLALIITSLLFILCSNGNKMRALYEIEHHFPVFNHFSLFEKVSLGFIVTSRYYFSKEGGKWIFLLFALVLLISVFIKNKNMIKRLISSVPLLSLFCLDILKVLWRHGFWNKGLRLLEVLWNNNGISDVSGYSSAFITLQGLFYLSIWFCIILSIWFINENKEIALLEITILSAGLLSRIIMGFSPTIYASGDRTALFASVALLIIATRHLLGLLRKPLRIS